MYHAQVPPPDHVWNGNLPGITWVDLVFPFFLFSMGAAFPLALSGRLERGVPAWKICVAIFERGLLLAFFALYVQAIRPYVLAEQPTTQTWLMALLGFFLLFPILTRFPTAWKPSPRWAFRLSGWVGAVLFLALAHYPKGGSFSLGRSDIIIVVLANMAVFGALLWLATRKHLLLRLGVLGILFAVRLSNMPKGIPGWVHDFWTWSPAPWIYQLYYLQYLFIIIPGTIAGDLLLQWLRDRDETVPSWPRWRYAAIASVMVGMLVVAVVGLKARWLAGTTAALITLGAAGWSLLSQPKTKTERLFRQLFGWALYWLVLGLCFEPYEGGIKKDKATLSYYFVTSGLAICLLIFFTIAFHIWNRRKWASLLIDNGQNPMIAYAGINNLVIPVLAFSSLDRVLDAFATTPWLGFVKGTIITLLVALFVSLCTRFKIFWRT
jgi:predicted acyltransferase